MSEPTYYGEPLSELKTLNWWPGGRDARVTAGFAGHDYEIVVNIDGYDSKEYIPAPVVSIFTASLPESWKVESRGTRIEVHPSGRFAGGYAPDDLPVVVDALKQMGLNITKVHDSKGDD